MIRSLENLTGYRLVATDGDIGTVEDFYFDDDTWLLRYVVVAAGGWLNRRNVLLSMDVAAEISDRKREMHVKLTKESVQASPDTETNKPVTRQKEILLAEHYGWKPYWTPDPFFGVGVPSERMEIDAVLPGADPHLRSFREVTTYVASGSGAEMFVLDMIANDSAGKVESLVVAPGRGHHVQANLIPVDRVSRIDWTNRLVGLKGDANAVMTPFDPSAGVNALRTAQYFDYLGRLHHTALLGEERN